MLDAKIQEINNSSSPGTSIYDVTVNSVNAAHLNLREAIVKYENIVEDLENVWESKVCKFLGILVAMRFDSLVNGKIRVA